MAEAKYKFAKPSGVKAEASTCPTPSTGAAPASPANAGLTGAKMMKTRPISPKALKRYGMKTVTAGR